ncbi:MAG TPA: NUDIX hydrolase [Thermoanaerobaculia bacterium]|nr:NUDIX hydrolase [Thermoanaerobaculia bacterium]
MRSALLPLSISIFLLLTMTAAAQRPHVPPAWWTEERSAAILARTETIRLAPDLSALTPGEQAALQDLVRAGEILHDLYEEALHHQALAARARLDRIDAALGHPRQTQNLRLLYRLFKGPVATTLENRREPFLDVDPQQPGRNVYPLGIGKDEVDAFIRRNPGRRGEILGERTVVRRATKENLGRDLAAMTRHPALDILHPGLKRRLTVLSGAPDAARLYAVPYAVAWADPLTKAHHLLRSAADKIEPDDPEFAGYLRNRARDLLTNDYESGDASWVTGRFGRLNAQIGAYETYDDALFGVKAFHGMSLLLKDVEATDELRRALGSLQVIENSLPYGQKKRVRDEISVGVYRIIADFGQARGTNTATILPNDPLYSARYGRTILLRENILRDPGLFAVDQRVWRASVADAHAGDLLPEGNVQRTLWHEVGHYLGVERDRHGRTLDAALQEWADALEEMKADLVSLFALHRMDHPSLRTIQASGIRRTLQNARPRRDQPYQTMQLAQFNYFLERGLIEADPQTTRLTIHYDRYAEVVGSLLEEVLALQYAGDGDAAGQFFQRWTTWTPELHERLAERVRQAQGASRFRIVRYGALGE